MASQVVDADLHGSAALLIGTTLTATAGFIGTPNAMVPGLNQSILLPARRRAECISGRCRDT
jgi:hypothetical protein